MMPFIHLFHFRGRPEAGVRTGVIILLMTVVSAAGFAVGANEPMTPSATTAAEAGMPAKPDASAEGMESSAEGMDTAVLAGGCFWGVEAVFDPEVITFDLLLEVFFNVAHDPTQLNFQGPDVGTQ
jgi:hypothetical protein